MDLSTILTSVALPIIVTSIVGYLAIRAGSYSKNIIEERKAWRDRIRELTTKAFTEIENNGARGQELKEIYVEFSTRLNPHDDHDQAILSYLRRYINENPNEKELRTFLSKIIKKPLCSDLYDSESSNSEIILNILKPHMEDNYKIEYPEPKKENIINNSYEFVDAISRLLKHDWQRAIWETKIIKIWYFKNITHPSNKIRNKSYDPWISTYIYDFLNAIPFSLMFSLIILLSSDKIKSDFLPFSILLIISSIFITGLFFTFLYAINAFRYYKSHKHDKTHTQEEDRKNHINALILISYSIFIIFGYIIFSTTHPFF